MRKALAVMSGLILAMTVCACAGKQKQIFLTQESQVKLRSIQSRVFDTNDRNLMLRTVIASLQDLGFVIDDADETLGTVSATKLKGYVLRITVSVRPRGDSQMIVRSNAQYNLQTIEDPEPYQQFFTALSKALFLEAQLVEEKETQTESSVTNPYTANDRLNKNKKEQKLAYIPKTAKNERVSLRSEAQEIITIDYIKYIVKRYDFFDNDWNISGAFHNDFVDNGDGTVTDRTTGLMWQKNGSSRARTWRKAKSYIKELNHNKFASYSDWRLPTIDELVSLLKKEKTDGLHIDTIFARLQKRAWSGDYDEGKQGVQASAWVANFSNGRTVRARFCILTNCPAPYSVTNVNLPDNYVRAVRTAK